MPSGKTHNHINQSLLITCIVIAVFYPQSPPNLWWLILGMAIGVNYLGPDLDIRNTRQDQNWGIFGVYWDLYAWLMPHRGGSHSSIMGLVTRLLFLFPPVLLLFVISQLAIWHQTGPSNWGETVNLFFHSLKYFLKTHSEPVSFVLFGIVSMDILHIGEDKLLYKVK